MSGRKSRATDHAADRGPSCDTKKRAGSSSRLCVSNEVFTSAIFEQPSQLKYEKWSQGCAAPRDTSASARRTWDTLAARAAAPNA
jgi:hypothetical protein